MEGLVTLLVAVAYVIGIIAAVQLIRVLWELAGFLGRH
jgi:hypothetical protein